MVEFSYKVEGLSHFVYSALSLFVNDKAIKEFNKIFLDFFWKNRPYKLKREVLLEAKVALIFRLCRYCKHL